MRQKLCVTLAVAVLALSGARETCKQLNGLKSFAGEWSGVWNTLLVYANAYAEGVESRPPLKTLIAASASSCRGDSATTRVRRARARVRQTPRAKRDGTGELRIDLGEVAFGFAAKPEATTPAATDEVSKPRLRVAANAGEIASALAGAFHSDFDAESLRALAAINEIEIPRASMLDVLMRQERAGVARKVSRVGAGGRGRDRFVFRLPELPRVSAQALHAVEAAAEVWPAADANRGPAGLGEEEVLFVVPQSSSGLLNCEAQPRR